MVKAPGIVGGTNGDPGASVAYFVADTSIPKYPLVPPPNVNGTAEALAFSCLRISWKTLKVGSPATLGSTLYSKYYSFRCILAALILLLKHYFT